MLQKEFIDRILATPDDDAFGLLSLRIQKNWIPRALKTIPPEAFHPRPRIDSTVMLLTPRPLTEFPPYDDRLMDEIMRKGFSQRRKQLKKQLPESREWSEVAHAMGITETVRPEELNLAQWVELVNHYDTSPLKGIPQKDDEIFDVVNDADEVIGQSSRKEIHEKGLIHRAVHILVRNKHGDILLQKRSPWKDRNPGVWDSSAAGHVDAGETYVCAATREIEEELGITDAELHEVAHFSPSEANGMEHIALMVAAYSGKVRFPAAEIEAVQWFSPEVINAWIARRPADFSRTFLQCWDFAMNPSKQ